ncbi:MAG: FAD-dependent oxidoreductase [Dehalococcoidia bacterium]|nr:FAD-dependent oxidoreductase [Dehalococcoidia bacterium]
MPAEKRYEDIDVLVIGGGLAGVYAAIRAKEAGANRVVQVDKGKVGKTGASCFAAGVMHTYFPDEDDLGDRVKRMTRAQGFLAQQDLMQDHIEQSWDITQEMASLGVEFVRTAEGKLERRAGRGSYPIISFYGPQLMDAMARAAIRKGITQLHRITITDLLTRDGRVTGAIGFNTRDGNLHVFKAGATVIATGNSWYKGLMPGHRDCSGDGYAMAFRAGAELSGADNNDAPTNVMPARYDIGPGMNKFVGEGGRLINAKGERFMEKYNPTLKERAGLRFLAFAFCLEAQQGNTPLFMDMTHLTPEQIRRLKDVLPLAMKMFESVGLVANERFTQPVEWMPMAPLGRPGLVVNRRFEATLQGLFACGEACSPQAVPTGLASAATSGATAGKSAAEFAGSGASPSLDEEQVKQLREEAYKPLQRSYGIEPDQILLAIQEAVIPYNVLLLRHGERMRRALQAVEDIRDNQLPMLRAYDPHYLRIAHEVRNLALVAELHLRMALARTESRVLLREDFPYEDNENWLKWIVARQDNGKVKLFTRDVPLQSYPYQVERIKNLNHMWQLAQKLGIVNVEKGEIQWA